MTTGHHIVVAGAGIGGLTAALCLARVGLPPLVLERAPGPYERGNGLQLGPNTIRILRRLELADAIEPHIVIPDRLRLRAAETGKTIATMPLGRKAERRYGAPYAVVERRALHRVLTRAAREAGIEVRYAASVDQVDDRGTMVSTLLEGGEELYSAALIGADGLWSRVRDLLSGGSPPRYSGRVAWRAIAPMERISEPERATEVSVWLGPRLHAVQYPIDGGRRLNLVVVTEGEWTGTGWDEIHDHATLLRTVTDLSMPLAEIIAAGEGWRAWPLFETRPALTPGHGRMTLIGDAAHPMLPFLAQGAGMAIEDAWVLADAVIENPLDVAGGFRVYEQVRRSRVLKVMEATRRNGRVWHMSGPARIARDIVLRRSRKRPEKLLTRYDWLYGGGPVPVAS